MLACGDLLVCVASYGVSVALYSTSTVFAKDILCCHQEEEEQVFFVPWSIEGSSVEAIISTARHLNTLGYGHPSGTVVLRL